MKTSLHHSETFSKDSIGELIIGCLKRDYKSQLGIYKMYYKFMYNLSLRIVNDAARAEIIMQESFLSAFEKIEDFRGERSFMEWLAGIVVEQSLCGPGDNVQTVSNNNHIISIVK